MADAVRDVVRSEIDDAFDTRLPEIARAASTPEYMTREEAASFLHRSVRSVDHLRKTGKLPYVRRGRRVVIRTSDLEAYLAEGFVPARRAEVSR